MFLDGNNIRFQISPSTGAGGSPTWSEIMRIDSSGNVGINTTSPQSKLQVAQPGNRNGGTILMGVGGSGTNKYSVLAGTHYNQASGSGNGAGSAGIMLIGSYATNGENDVIIGGNVWEVNAATTIRFYTHTTDTSTNGGSERMRIDSSGIVYIMGAAASSNNSLQMQYNSTAGTAEIYAKSTGGNTSFEFYASNAGTTNKVVTFDKEGIITSKTNNGAYTAIHLRTITVPYSGNTGTFTFDIDPVATFGTRVSGGRMKLEVSGWGTRMNAGYIVYRNDGSGSGKIGTGDVVYYRYAWSETSGTQAMVAVSLPSSSTNVVRISFSGWHTNDHGFEARLTATS
jgi:hypothetical protein